MRVSEYESAYICMYVYMYTTCIHCSWRPEEGMDPLELMLEIIVNYHVDAGNHLSQLPCKSKKCS